MTKSELHAAVLKRRAVLVSEEGLRRIFPGWRIPGVLWHLGRIDGENLICLPQVGVNVHVDAVLVAEIFFIGPL